MAKMSDEWTGNTGLEAKGQVPYPGSYKHLARQTDLQINDTLLTRLNAKSLVVSIVSKVVL